MGLLTFSINVTLDGCVDHQEGIADDETHAFFKFWSERSSLRTSSTDPSSSGIAARMRAGAVLPLTDLTWRTDAASYLG